jgi:hypothetical protein
MSKKSRILRDDKKLGGNPERIEIRYPLTLPTLISLKGGLPIYQIDSIHRKISAHLGQVWVEEDKWNPQRYVIKRRFNDFGEEMGVLGYRATLADAKFFAYRTAQIIGKKIAKKNKIPLEDLALEDEEKLEGQEMDHKLSISHQRRLAIFIGSILGGIALSVYSLISTGNTIGNLTGTTQGLLGIFLFVLGIFGLVFNS